MQRDIVGLWTGLRQGESERLSPSLAAVSRWAIPRVCRTVMLVHISGTSLVTCVLRLQYCEEHYFINWTLGRFVMVFSITVEMWHCASIWRTTEVRCTGLKISLSSAALCEYTCWVTPIVFTSWRNWLSHQLLLTTFSKEKLSQKEQHKLWKAASNAQRLSICQV